MPLAHCSFLGDDQIAADSDRNDDNDEGKRARENNANGREKFKSNGESIVAFGCNLL
jgi:hypothetical protein